MKPAQQIAFVSGSKTRISEPLGPVKVEEDESDLVDVFQSFDNDNDNDSAPFKRHRVVRNRSSNKARQIVHQVVKSKFTVASIISSKQKPTKFMEYFQQHPSLIQNIYFYKHDAARHLNYIQNMFCLVSGRNAQEVDLRKRTPIPVLKTIQA